ncbi:helix-turn-helix domain-containing protein [Ciceribacter selenitireducens]|uniref:helix-turn-helix domain-containing protein n=1 Tax=Ciceribacter selenitireducens TaxID=448181 RepID=UPI003AF31D1C
MRRFAVLRPHLEEGVSLVAAARAADVPIRTTQRWLSRYRLKGLDGLKIRKRSDYGTRRLPEPLIALIEGLALRKPRLSCAAICRRTKAIAKSRDWPVPSYSTVHSIVQALDPAVVTLAQDGASECRTADTRDTRPCHRGELSEQRGLPAGLSGQASAGGDFERRGVPDCGARHQERAEHADGSSRRRISDQRFCRRRGALYRTGDRRAAACH